MASRETLGKRRKKKWIIFISIISILFVVRFILPYVLLHYANKTLANMDGYYGHVTDLDLSLFRGAYMLEDFYIDKVDSTSQEHTPFISSQVIDLSVEWKSLFNQRIVGEIECVNPVLRFTKDKAEAADIQKDTTDFRKVLKTFMPLKINRLEIFNGKVQYIDSTSTPIVNIALTNANILAQNLSSVSDTATLPSTVVATANVYDGTFNLRMRLNALATEPTYDLNAELKNTNLPELNSFFKAYGNFDVSEGTFGMYTELASKNGKFIGYVKPIITNLKVIGPEDRNDTFISKLYEAVIGTAGVILKNPKEKQVATKIPIEGEYEKTTIRTWYAIVHVLQNAFVQAIYPSIDDEISILSVSRVKTKENETIIQKIFSNSDKKDKKNKKRNE